jgi:hypothetical protein
MSVAECRSRDRERRNFRIRQRTRNRQTEKPTQLHSFGLLRRRDCALRTGGAAPETPQ